MHAFHAVITSHFPLTKYRSCSQYYKKIIIQTPFTSAEPKITLHCNLLTVVFHEFLRKIPCYVLRPP
jgi:hypothetical protein